MRPLCAVVDLDPAHEDSEIPRDDESNQRSM